MLERRSSKPEAVPSGKPRPAPLQPREPSKVPVHRDPVAAMLNGQGGEPGVSDAWAHNGVVNAQAAKDAPVTFTGLDEPAVQQVHQILAKAEGIVERTGTTVWLAREVSGVCSS